MDESTLAVPEPAPPASRPHDPLAVALGNASLLGVGYLLQESRFAVRATGVHPQLPAVGHKLMR
ncbi:hypothetical protein [Streptomyces sp. NPDC094472]|uniref:hypothetical protein n=1 Tax=unclassified Streptomyces TaxID=2593676 RepID=UPI0033178E8C